MKRRIASASWTIPAWISIVAHYLWAAGLVCLGLLCIGLAISFAVTEANSNYMTADPWFPRLKYIFSLLGVCMAATGGTIAYRQWRLHLRQKRDACPTCGYSLTGNTSGTCPECGTAIPKPTNKESPRPA